MRGRPELEPHERADKEERNNNVAQKIAGDVRVDLHRSDAGVALRVMVILELMLPMQQKSFSSDQDCFVT